MGPQGIGVALVIAALFLWLLSWVGLASYGLIWLPRDRSGASISLLASLAVLSYGIIILTQMSGVTQ